MGLNMYPCKYRINLNLFQLSLDIMLYLVRSSSINRQKIEGNHHNLLRLPSFLFSKMYPCILFAKIFALLVLNTLLSIMTRYNVDMYIDRIPNRNSKPCILLRESYRVGKQVRKRTINNLSKWPAYLVEELDILLHGGTAIESLPKCFEIQRSLPHGHVAAVLGTLRRLGLDKMISSQACPERDRVIAIFEGRNCPLAQFGYSRDGKKDKRQIVFGLLCTLEGLPIAVEVFQGNTSDSKTLTSQINKVRKTFGIDRVIFVGDRGMITQTRIQEDLQHVEGLDWITALTAAQVKELMNDDTLQPSLFDEQDLAEIQSPDYPGERLVACRNPLWAAERKRKRDERLQATEKELDKIVTATQRAYRPLRGKDKIGLRVGRVLGRFKVGKHFNLTIE